MWLVEINDFKELFHNKPLFDQPVKNEQEAYEKLVKMLRCDDYIKGNFIDYSHHQKIYKHSAIDLARQANTSIPK